MIEDSEITTIRLWATRFRSAIEKAAFPAWSGNLTHFPSECCHHSCVLLKRFLSEKQLGEFSTFSGTHPTSSEGGRHHWLKKGDVIVDITADQFGYKRVIVARSSPWHDSLNGKRLPSTQEDDELLWVGDGFWRGYAALYSLILPHIEDHVDS